MITANKTLKVSPEQYGPVPGRCRKGYKKNNSLINQGKKIGVYHIPNDQHNAVGTPEDLIKYTDRVYAYENR